MRAQILPMARCWCKKMWAGNGEGIEKLGYTMSLFRKVSRHIFTYTYLEANWPPWPLAGPALKQNSLSTSWAFRRFIYNWYLEVSSLEVKMLIS